jgi:general secretion pathway protein J
MIARQRGFTLLELLVALTVLGLIMVAVVQGARYGIKGWDTEAHQLDATAELDGIDRVFRELAHGISPVRNGNFNGQRTSVSFVGRLPLAVPASRRAAALTLSVSADHRLMLRWTPYRHATPLVAAPVAQVELLRNVRSIELSYWASPRDAGGWQSALSGTMPSLIRLHIVFMKGDPRHWPDFIAAPVVNTTGAQL